MPIVRCSKPETGELTGLETSWNRKENEHLLAWAWVFGHVLDAVSLNGLGKGV